VAIAGRYRVPDVEPDAPADAVDVEETTGDVGQARRA
jgi:hypothetical protein